MHAEGSPLISVVVLTANRRAMLERCLRSLAAQEFAPFEVVVIDNGSTDDTCEWLGEQTIISDLRLVESEGKGSFAEARNLGVDAAAGRFIAFLDDDCAAHPGWLARIAANLEEVDAVGGRVVPPPNLDFPWWWDRRMNWAVGLQGPEHEDPATAGVVAYPDTSNLAVRRDVLRREPFQDVGGRLDGSESVYRWGREDAELWRRLRVRGYRTRFDPTQMVTHHIDPRRLRWAYVARRARMDGRSLWARERDVTYLDAALGDLAAWPWRALGCLGRPPSRWIPTYLARAMWRRRQMGFVMACLRDRGWRTGAKPAGHALRGSVSGAAKRAARPLLWLACRLIRGALWRRLPREPGHVVIACQGFLGDTVLLGPMIEVLRRRWPEARLTLVSNPFGHELHGANPNLTEVIAISPPRFLFGWERWKEIRRTLRGLRPDVILVPYWHNTPAWPLLVSQRAPVVGFDRDMGFERRLWTDLLDRRVPKDWSRHEIENHLALARAVGATGEPSPGHGLPPLPEGSPHVLALFAEHALTERGFVAFHVGAAGEGKAWPDERWGTFAKNLRERRPELRLVFVGHARLRMQVHRLIEDHGLEAVNACATRPLSDLAEILRAARLLVTTDSGPKHLAMAIGTPTLTLYGESSPVRWGMWGDDDRHRALVSPGWDLRPEELGARGPDHKMALITVEEVEGAAEAMLGCAQSSELRIEN